MWVLGTGSSGNALIVESGDTRLWVDAGIGPRAAASRMNALGGDLFPRGVDGVVITHEHGDHCAQLESLGKALSLPKRGAGEAKIFLHDGIGADRVRARFETARLTVSSPLTIGDLTVEAMEVSHDAPQVAFRFRAGDTRFGYATDLGSFTSALAAFLGNCDTVLLEANYCPSMLASGPYPSSLKRRISSATGHLSNEQTAELVSATRYYGSPAIVLCHLSRGNNEPGLAQRVVASARPDLDVQALGHGEARILDVGRASS